MKNQTTIVGGNKAHSKYGASKSPEWMNCPGSIALSEKAPEQPEGPWAAEGTEAHECLETILKNPKKLEAAARMASKSYPKEMVQHGLEAAQYVVDIFKSCVDAELFCEQKVDSSFFTMEGQFGTLDAAVVEEFGTLWIFDYKYGKGYAVDPEGEDGLGNSQLAYYALAIAKRYNFNFFFVNLVVIQPRAFHPSGNTTRIFRLTITELLAWEKRFRKAVKRTQTHAEEYNAGPWCKFCKAVLLCPALKKDAAKEAEIVFGPSGSLDVVPEPMLVKAPSLGKMLDAADKLEMWIEKLRAHAVHVLHKGGKIDGYKLVEKRAMRKWKNEDEAEAFLFEHFGEDGFVTKPITPADAQKRGSKLRDKIGFSKQLEKRTVKESSGYTMAKDSDKRREIVPAEEVFGK